MGRDLSGLAQCVLVWKEISQRDTSSLGLHRILLPVCYIQTTRKWSDENVGLYTYCRQELPLHVLGNVYRIPVEDVQ